jgi:hypothetical protein
MQPYLNATRSPWYSYLACLPLLVLYQVGTVLANLGHHRPVINGADALLQMLFGQVGLHGWLGTGVALAVLAGIVVVRVDARHWKAPLRAGYFPLMLLESAIYACLLGFVVAYLVTYLVPGVRMLQMGTAGLGFGQLLAGSLGAGLYEELVFRLLLAGGTVALLRRTGMRQAPAMTVAVLSSSLLFSLFHYIGPFGEPMQWASFSFRAVGGIVLAGLFFLRGLGVVAWTHALYNVFLLLAQGH